MKNLLILATMLLTVGFANAQSKIYRGNSTSDRNLIGTYDGGMMSGAAGAAFLLLL